MNKDYYVISQGEENTALCPVWKSLDNGVQVLNINGVGNFTPDPMKGVLYEMPVVEDAEAYSVVKRRCEYWCKPEFGTDLSLVPDETQFLLVKHTDATFTLLLPVVLDKYRCVLKGQDGKLYLRMFSQYEEPFEIKGPVLVLKRCENPYTAIRELFKTAIEESGAPIALREDRTYPDILEYLGWCSWDAMQIRVCEDGLLEKCRELKQKNIPVRWGIIDDMWAYIPKFKTGTYSNFDEMVQLMHSSELGELGADPDRFPNGLEGAIEKMKEYLSWVGVWYPSTGYWAGIDPDSRIFETLKEHLGLSTSKRWLAKPEYTHFKAFFDTFNDYLKGCGADFVKIDNQSNVRQHYKYLRPLGLIAKEMHQALEESVEPRFGSRLINCMGCISENVWNRPGSSVSRCSGDFMPEDAAWFTQHILQCSFMSFFQSSLIWCDWDMWWTDDGQAKKNSLLRAMSGGPVYVSDQIGRSNREVLMPLCLEDGKILRCQNPALPARDCLVSDPQTNGRIFKVQNLCGAGGAVAAFHLAGEGGPVCGSISPDDVEGLEGTEFAVYEYFSHSFYTMKQHESMTVELENSHDFRLYIFVPIVDGFAAIGRTDKFMSPLTVAAVEEQQIKLVEDGPFAYYLDGNFYEEIPGTR